MKTWFFFNDNCFETYIDTFADFVLLRKKILMFYVNSNVREEKIGYSLTFVV